MHAYDYNHREYLPKVCLRPQLYLGSSTPTVPRPRNRYNYPKREWRARDAQYWAEVVAEFEARYLAVLVP